MDDLICESTNKEYKYLNSTNNLTTEMFLVIGSEYNLKFVEFVNEKLNKEGLHYKEINILNCSLDEQSRDLIFLLHL